MELAKVLTVTNRAEVLPCFYGRSSQEAKEVVAALNPLAAFPQRAVVTALSRPKVAFPPVTVLQTAGPTAAAAAELLPAAAIAGPAAVQLTEPQLTYPTRDMGLRDDVEPLTADLRRLHITVDAQFLKLLDRARDGLSHSIPGASTEQVLKAALDLLIEKQARSRGLVKRPRTVVALATSAAIPSANPTTTAAPSVPSAAATATATVTAAVEGAAETPPQDLTPPLHRRTDARQHVPAAISRAVWQRDGGRCSWPLDSGGVCGSTHRLELDHVVPWARWGGETVDDLRVVCHPHNALAARQAFGARCVDRYAGRRGRGDQKVRPPGGSQRPAP